MKAEQLELYLVTDRKLAAGRPLTQLVEEAIQGGVTMVQLREKECSTREFLALAEEIHALCRRAGVPLLINDRLDIALAVDAEGVHVGQSDMPAEIARKLLGKDKIIGLSVESVEDALAAQHLPVDYLGVSPIYLTPTKTDLTHQLGLEGLRAIRAVSSLPLVGIGGLHAGNAGDVIRAGADGVAVVSAICAAETPRAAAEELRRAIREAKEIKS
ncbi:MAG: thiamine phosphate synthase [candidate division KSB1 bacterium]|nr:thiamine phosphate synthase [candidate division KSB1 bacterium]MDZ7345212.1 thiamine phosphate synthase [candidate division KSB1 bacterium]